ncbi:MAG: hypothetical protein ACRYG8_15345 [Janthinobacterium lividum]
MAMLSAFATRLTTRMLLLRPLSAAQLSSAQAEHLKLNERSMRGAARRHSATASYSAFSGLMTDTERRSLQQ